MLKYTWKLFYCLLELHSKKGGKRQKQKQKTGNLTFEKTTTGDSKGAFALKIQ